ncbi:hypothetical protein CRUP_012859 [Coryphaenoides rupestris]|nr:hypothetical protein CRUP_012859 [Coryphaenoides rupestris]
MELMQEAVDVLWGGWGMVLYLSFPVTMFWISNQAEYFEEYIVKRKREIFPPNEHINRMELEEFKQQMRSRRERRLLKEREREREMESQS